MICILLFSQLSSVVNFLLNGQTNLLYLRFRFLCGSATSIQTPSNWISYAACTRLIGADIICEIIVASAQVCGTIIAHPRTTRALSNGERKTVAALNAAHCRQAKNQNVNELHTEDFFVFRWILQIVDPQATFCPWGQQDQPSVEGFMRLILQLIPLVNFRQTTVTL